MQTSETPNNLLPQVSPGETHLIHKPQRRTGRAATDPPETSHRLQAAEKHKDMYIRLNL